MLSNNMLAFQFGTVLCVLVVQVFSQRFASQQDNIRQNTYNTNTRNSPQIPQSSVNCPDKNGRYPTRTCDGYIECVDGVGVEKTCPDGLLFNPAAGIFSYPCQYPIDVDCSGREQTQSARSTDECPHQYGYFSLGDSTHCGQFINCVDGRGYVFDCPEGLAFNAETYRCDWPDKVSSCDAEAYLGFSCPPEARNLGAEEYRYFRSSNDCQRYYICINGKPRLYSCGEGNAFNDLNNACDSLENVTGCALPQNNYNVPQNPNFFRG